jgi:predicted phosphodiesterase
MRYGIFSDVHGNLEAFEVTLDYYKTQSIDKFIFLGDIVGYGANPCQCVELLQSLNAVTVAGNHDWAVIDKLEMEYFNEEAQAALFWTKKELTAENIGYLKSFELVYRENNFICVHSSLNSPAEFNYILGLGDAYKNFTLLKEQILFIGHTHRAEAYCYSGRGTFYIAQSTIGIDAQEKYIINLGSVGQPRDRNARASVCIYDTNVNMLIFERLEYNIKKAADKILSKGLPAIFAQRLYAGW